MGEQASGRPYPGLYVTEEKYHHVVVWDELIEWLNQVGKGVPLQAESEQEKSYAIALFYKKFVIKLRWPEVATCAVLVGKCEEEADHFHVMLDDVVLEEGGQHAAPR